MTKIFDNSVVINGDMTLTNRVKDKKDKDKLKERIKIFTEATIPEPWSFGSYSVTILNISEEKKNNVLLLRIDAEVKKDGDKVVGDGVWYWNCPSFYIPDGTKTEYFNPITGGITKKKNLIEDVDLAIKKLMEDVIPYTPIK